MRFESPNPQSSGQWGQRLRTVPDLNGDGKNEFLNGGYRESFGGFPTAGRVYMQDGATRNVIYFIDSPQIQANAQFGFVPAVIGDVNGDGKADFVAGADGQDTLADGTACTPPTTGPLGTCNQDQGKAWVFSGANGQTLYALDHPKPQGFGRFGIWTGRAGDINDDGVPDVIIGASTSDVPAGCGNGADGRRLAAEALPAGCRADEGEAYIFSGKVGDHAGSTPGLLRTLNLPASDQMPAPCGGTGTGAIPCGSFGIPVQGVGDVTGDGVVDQLAGAPFLNFDTATNGPCADPRAPTCNKAQGAVYLFNGATGALIRRTDSPVPQAEQQYGLHDPEQLAPGDVNGDGRADYFSAAYLLPAPSGEQAAGRAWVTSGATGNVLYEVKDPTPNEGGQFGFSVSRTDYNRDGIPDLYVGQAPHHRSAVDQSGGTYIFDGKDGSLLKSLELPASDAQPGATGNLGANLGWTAIAPGDLNGDGEPDYVAGAPFSDVGPSAFSCQAPTPGCLKDVGREYFFYSKLPASGGGASGGGTTTAGAAGGQTNSTASLTPRPLASRPTARARRKGTLSARVTAADLRAPFRFRTTGRLALPSRIARSVGCTGRVSVQIKRGSATISTRRVSLRKDCTFSSQVSFINARRFARVERLKFIARFLGNKLVSPATAPTRLARVRR
ncbi:MAG: VCBS repeat-containing protein [Actinomycetota bacterium]|nr:VCBS repeat-containing protein [Actinomycetota bacterium]